MISFSSSVRCFGLIFLWKRLCVCHLLYALQLILSLVSSEHSNPFLLPLLKHLKSIIFKNISRASSPCLIYNLIKLNFLQSGCFYSADYDCALCYLVERKSWLSLHKFSLPITVTAWVFYECEL